MANVIEMKCPSCGGQMNLENENKRILKCPYCDCQVMLGEQINHNYNISNNYINAKNVTVTGISNSSSLWEKYAKLIKLQDRASAVKVLDQILEDNPYDIKALKEKIRIADYYLDKGEVLAKFAAGETLEKMAVYYVKTLFDKEFQYMRMLTSDKETLEAIKGSFVWTKIEVIYRQCQEKQVKTIEWSDLPSDKFFSLVNSSQIMNSSDYAKSEVRHFREYLNKCYDHGGYYLDSLDFMLLQDKKRLVMRARSSDGDYTSFLVFSIRGRELIAPPSFASGEFEFKPSLFNKRYEFKSIGNRKRLIQSCKIVLSQYRDGSYYALTFGDNQTVFFTETHNSVEENGSTIKYGRGVNGIPMVVDIR